MKTDRFRIIPKDDNAYIIKRKGLIFWWTIKTGCYDLTWPKQFYSKEDARNYIDRLLEQETLARKHLKQGVEEYPA